MLDWTKFNPVDSDFLVRNYNQAGHWKQLEAELKFQRNVWLLFR